MAITSVTFTGNGTTGPYVIPFPYIAPDHVHVLVNDVEVGFTFLTPSTIALNVAAPNGADGLIRRTTPDAAPLVDWENGATLDEDSLDIQTKQLLYLFQETVETAKAQAATAAALAAQGVIESEAAEAVEPEDFGAVGDGVTDDSAAFVSALNALASAGGGTLWLKRRYFIPTPVIIPHRIKVLGDDRATIVTPSSGALAGGLQLTHGGIFSGTISVNAALFDNALTLTSATNFTVGRLVSIFKTVGGGVFYHHCAQIVSVASNTITLSSPMPFALSTGDTYTLQAFIPTDDVTISDLNFEGQFNTSLARGLFAQYTRNLTLSNLRFKDYRGGAAAYVDFGLGTRLSNLLAIDSGTGSEAAFNVRAQTAMHAQDIRDRQSWGFGQLWFMITHSHMAQLSSQRAGLGAVGRGVKFDGMLHSTADQIEGNDSSATGVAITLGSDFNTFSNIIALRNRGATGNDVGLWFDGTSNNNQINGVVALNNLTFDIDIPGGSNNGIINARAGTVRNLGSRNTVQQWDNPGLQLIAYGAISFDAANTDFQLNMHRVAKYWWPSMIVVINKGPAAAINTATGGVFTAVGGGGLAVAADQALQLTLAGPNFNGSVDALALAAGAIFLDDTINLWYRTGTAQGAAAVGVCYVYGHVMPD